MTLGAKPEDQRGGTKPSTNQGAVLSLTGWNTLGFGEAGPAVKTRAELRMPEVPLPGLVARVSDGGRCDLDTRGPNSIKGKDSPKLD
jgi:hypothetical protein